MLAILWYMPDGDEPGRPVEVVREYLPAYAEWAAEKPDVMAHLSYILMDPASEPPGGVLSSGYVAAGAVAVRPTLDLPETVSLPVGETRELSVPLGARLIIDGDEAGTCDDGVLTISGEMTDTYRIDVRAWPHRYHTIIVTVGE